MAKEITRGGIVKLTQEDFEDGIQVLVVEMEDGTKLEQRWSWPDCKPHSSGVIDRALGDGSEYRTIHNKVYYGLIDQMDPNDLYSVIQVIATQIDGPKLTAVATESNESPYGVMHAE